MTELMTKLDILIANLLSRYFLFAVILLLTACFLVSDNEIKKRISDAIPAGIMISTVDIKKELSCIASSFILHGKNSPTALNYGESRQTESGLGENWYVTTSFYEYSKQVSDPTLKTAIEGTALHSKPCLGRIGVNLRFLYEKSIHISQSRSGKELIMLYEEAGLRRGIYVAQGE